MISLEFHDAVAILRLDRGITNAINMELVTDLSDCLKSVRENTEVCGIVLSSTSSKFFSIGFDIPHLFDLPRNEFTHFLKSFDQVCLNLFAFPKPTIAAITGHAIAGGCILALCCDYRFIADGRRLMGLNEINLGVPLPYVAGCILRHLAGMRHARDIAEGGLFYEPPALLQMGMVDQMLPASEVEMQAVQRVKTLGSSPDNVFALFKQDRLDQIETEIRLQLPVKEKIFIQRWYSKEARIRLEQAMKKF